VKKRKEKGRKGKDARKGENGVIKQIEQKRRDVVKLVEIKIKSNLEKRSGGLKTEVRRENWDVGSWTRPEHINRCV
jgi:hypothetical protein